jgi:hypothetical protein
MGVRCASFLRKMTESRGPEGVTIYPSIERLGLAAELPAWNFQIGGKFTRLKQEKKRVSSTKRERAQDRARVAGQDHEVRYEAKKEGVTKDAVEGAVKDVGNSRTKVEADLEKKR